MATFLAEMYVPRGRAGERAALDRRARAAAAALSAEGTPVRHLRSLFVPDDEMCLHFFEAPATDAVAEVSRRGGYSYERIVEATEHLFVPESEGPGGKEKGTWSGRGS